MKTVLMLVPLLMCSCRSSRESTLRASGVYGQVKEISAAQLKSWMADGQSLALIDVREDHEWRAGHAATAIHIPRLLLASRIETAVPDKNARIVLYCLGGVRSAAAAATLQVLGYTNVFSLRGGFRNYQAGGLPVQVTATTATGFVRWFAVPSREQAKVSRQRTNG